LLGWELSGDLLRGDRLVWLGFFVIVFGLLFFMGCFLIEFILLIFMVCFVIEFRLLIFMHGLEHLPFRHSIEITFVVVSKITLNLGDEWCDEWRSSFH
jgi:hypothetical protein